MIAFAASGLSFIRGLRRPTGDGEDVRDGGKPKVWLIIRDGEHVDAVHRAGRHTQVAAGAFIDDHGVHELGRAYDSVDRAGLNAFRAADAFSFANVGDLRRGRATFQIQAQHRQVQQVRQPSNGFITAWWAFVDRLALSNALRIRHAARVSAFATLGLGQQGVDALDQVHGLAGSRTGDGYVMSECRFESTCGSEFIRESAVSDNALYAVAPLRE